MKKLLLAVTLSVLASNAQAGSYGPPAMEPEIIIEETVEASASDEWALVLMAFLIFIVAGMGQ